MMNAWSALVSIAVVALLAWMMWLEHKNEQ